MDNGIQLPTEVTQKVFVILRQSKYDTEPKVIIADYDLERLNRDPGEICVTLGAHEITLPVPQSFDILGRQVTNLKEQKQKVLAEAQVVINQIDERINSLLALEYKPE